jgi:hypothetical protein
MDPQFLPCAAHDMNNSTTPHAVRPRRIVPMRAIGTTLLALTIVAGAGACHDASDATSQTDGIATNLLAGRIPSTNASSRSRLAYITDGVINTSRYADLGGGSVWIQFDLGASTSVGQVNVWHYFGDGRRYHDVIVQLSNSSSFASGVTTVFNNDADNSSGQGAGAQAEYAENSAGKTVTFPPVSARYLRLWSRGSSANAYNHYVEVQAFAASASDAGIVDTGVVDTGVVDTGVVDTGAVDAGAVDTGAVDTGTPDSGAIDAGALDAGALDGGTTDSGVIDGGMVDPRGLPFTKLNFIYGAQIGAWDMNGGTAVNNATARANVIGARIPVIRWQMWRPPCDLRSTNCQTTAQFNAGIDGIRALGAEPLIGLPPIWDQQCSSGPDPWSYAWQQWIVRTAGNRVRLYEMANEPDNYCSMTGQQYHDQLWVNVAPLKSYARSLGLEIFVGGPAWANSYSGNLSQIEQWLSLTASDYRAHGNNRDWIPDFVSTHTYLVTPSENDTQAHAQARIDSWGAFYESLRTYINTTFAGMTDRGYPIANELLLMDSEYNDTIVTSWTGNDSQAWTDFYMGAMIDMFRADHVWAGIEFTIASHGGQALDMLTTSGTAKPLYNSFRARSTSDPNNP